MESESETLPLDALRKFNLTQFSPISMQNTSLQLPSKSISDLKHRFMCVCGRTFLHSAHVRYHKRWECGKDLSCRICFRKFVTISNLKRHQKGCKELDVKENIF